MPILTLAVIVLLPVLPAYLLFTALPSTGGVAGKLFKGLEIKLGGAFAGYIVVMLIIFNYPDVWRPVAPPPPPQTAFVWHLSGRITDDSGTAIEPLDVKDFSFLPPTFQSIPGGNFVLTIPTEPEQGGGTRFPVVTINRQDYLTVTVPLDPSELNGDALTSLGVTRDEAHRQIKMQHISLKKAPPYRPNGLPPKRLSGPAPKRSLAASSKVNP
jgi:hypothetical protein